MELTVTFIVLATGQRVTKRFAEYPQCRNFVLRARHSKKIALVSYPNFSE